MQLRQHKGKKQRPDIFIDYRLDGVRRRKRLEGIHDRPTAEVAMG